MKLLEDFSVVATICLAVIGAAYYAAHIYQGDVLTWNGWVSQEQLIKEHVRYVD
jgi:hypothetical protein